MTNKFLDFLSTLDIADDSLIESIASAYMLAHPLVEMKEVSSWGNGMEPGKRIGKSDRNINKAKEKNANPVTVRFHRTNHEYVDSIQKNGLQRKNENYGENTGDVENYDNVIWTADNPDDIPVLRRMGDCPRYAKKVDTFKISMPKDEYNKTNRMKFDNGHRNGTMQPAKPGENTLANEGHYKIDVFNQDIPATNLQLMPKKHTQNDIDEMKEFNDWRNGENHVYTTLSPDGDEIDDSMEWKNIEKTLPADVRNSPFDAKNPKMAAHNLALMDKIAANIKPVAHRFDWDRYNDAVSGGLSPAYAASAAVIHGHSNRPWRDNGRYRDIMVTNLGHVTRGPARSKEMAINKSNAENKRYSQMKNDMMDDYDTYLYQMTGEFHKKWNELSKVNREIKSQLQISLNDEIMSVIYPEWNTLTYDQRIPLWHKVFNDMWNAPFSIDKSKTVREAFNDSVEEAADRVFDSCKHTPSEKTKRTLIKRLKAYAAKQLFWNFEDSIYEDTVIT